ncbi:thioredoxin family protein [Halopiger djelfimassiliensis]|uniref:thioredoxin family protein n=1 Tax=Halopiger djelfimassiliensis TaxID=1293047 RepID=UPI0006780DEA|nr:thioredoxin family protein [Halopiger djelfimassiliensis]
MGNVTATPVRLADGDELDAFVDRHDVALVELYTRGCPKCQAMEPVLGNVARATDVPVGMVNPGDDLTLVDRFDIESVPALVLFRNGTAIAHSAEGFQGGDEVVAFLDTHVPDAVESE